jgi:CubicO group peptidase (beta-lactamase class C family)
MKRVIGLLTVVLLVAGWCRSSLATDAAPTDAQIKAALSARTAKVGPDASIVFGWVDASGARVIVEGKGPGGKPLDGNSVFEIGSASKVFTCLALADMVKKGEVKLEDPVAKYLPKSVRMPSRGGKQITLADLATHTSGLPRMPDNLKPKDPWNPYADYTVQQMYAFLSSYELKRDIGAEFEYSNLGVGLLGHVLALKAGSSYETLIVRRICTPLKMTDTRIMLSADQKARLVTGHGPDGKPAKNWDIPTLAGAGALRSTANDMLKFVAANAGLAKSDLYPAMELSHEERHEAGSSVLSVGLGWHILHRTGGVVVWHNGQTGGYHSFVAFDKAAKRGVVVLANFAAEIDSIGMEFVAPKQAPGEHVAIQVDPKIYDAYVGTYRVVPGVEFTVKREKDQLMVQLTGQTFLPVFPESETEFFYKGVDAQLTFKKNAAGEVSGLVLHQAGLDQTATKVK